MGFGGYSCVVSLVWPGPGVPLFLPPPRGKQPARPPPLAAASCWSPWGFRGLQRWWWMISPPPPRASRYAWLTSRGPLYLYWPGRGVHQVNEDRCTWQEGERKRERKRERVRECEEGGEKKDREWEKGRERGYSSSFLLLQLDAISLSFFSTLLFLSFSFVTFSRTISSLFTIYPSLFTSSLFTIDLLIFDYLLLFDVSCLPLSQIGLHFFVVPS